MATTEIRSRGYWLSNLGAVGDLKWSTRAPRGSSLEASWVMDASLKANHPALQRGAIVEVMVGPSRLFYGALAEPVPSPEGWEFVANGMTRVAERYLCLSAAGASTSVPDTAIDQAIARGLQVTRPASLSAVAYKAGDATDGLNRLGPLLDGWAIESGKRWGVTPSGQIVAASDPTVPRWHMTPGSGSLGVADEEYASELYGRYIDGSGNYQTAHVGDAAATIDYGRAEEPVDLTSLGAMTLARAQGILNGMLLLGSARLGWANGLEPSRFELTTPGGCSADLRFVQGGDMVRLHGVLDRTRRASLTVDVVIGETRYTDGEATIQLLPVDLAPRTLSDVLSVEGGSTWQK
jgi:hypothetical protein